MLIKATGTVKRVTSERSGAVEMIVDIDGIDARAMAYTDLIVRGIPAPDACILDIPVPVEVWGQEYPGNVDRGQEYPRPSGLILL